MKTLVTGGCGFIGSNLVDRLVGLGDDIIIYDNLSTGFLSYIEPLLKFKKVTFTQGNILNTKDLTKSMVGVDRVFHLAAHADVKSGIKNTRRDISQNILGTFSVLESMKKSSVFKLVFTSSAAVYGEPSVFPTPETYSPSQTSMYGASKLSAEGIIQAYGEYFGIKSHIFRFVSWLGKRYSHGVVFDFVKQLLKNPKLLKVLGDGTQTKSFLNIRDGINGVLLPINSNTSANQNIFNLGHSETINISTLANIVINEMNLQNTTRVSFTGGTRGWIGDSPYVHLDISKIMSYGFSPSISIEESIQETVRFLLKNTWIFTQRKN